MKQRINRVIVSTLLLLTLGNVCYAQGNIEIVPLQEITEKEQEISVKIQINNTEVAACTLEIYWDMENLEYVRGPENSNYSNHRILAMWVSEDGEDKTQLEIGDFVFKVLQEENTNIRVMAECYNTKGEKVEVESGVLVLKKAQKKQMIEELVQETTEVEADNTSLKILRLNQEGISPDFQKEIKEYYFIADSSINNLEVTAIPENPNATVMITGNTNLKMGENKIEIRVVSQDESKEAVYQIHVTRTENKELANANLENLAVRQGTLVPEFDANYTKYRVEIPSQTSQIDILAIPQKEKASVTIVGNETMQIGDNTVQIQVLAEDGITNKNYEIIVHRRNEQEEQQYERERENQSERLSVILKEIEQEENKATVKEKKNLSIIWIIVGAISTITIIGIIAYRTKKSE